MNRKSIAVKNNKLSLVSPYHSPMSVDSDNEENFNQDFDLNRCHEEETLLLTSRDPDTLESQSSTESKHDAPIVTSKVVSTTNSVPLTSASRFRTPVSKALQRVFRSRSSSPRISSVSPTRKDSPSRGEDPLKGSNLLLTEHHDENYLHTVEDTAITEANQSDITTSKTSSVSFSDEDDAEKFLLPSDPGALIVSPVLESLARKSMTQLNKSPDSLEVKPIVTSRSFSCLQSSLFKGSKGESNPFGKRRSEEGFRSSRFVSKKRSGLSKSNSSKDLPKVYISIDDDHPRSPDEEAISAANFLFDSSSDLTESQLMMKDSSQAEAVHSEYALDKASDEEELSDKEKFPASSQKVTNILKSWSMLVNKGSESNHEVQEVSKQPSQDSDQVNSSFNEDSVSPTNSIDLPLHHDSKVPRDSRLKMLRKFTLTLQGKEKSNKAGLDHKSTTEGEELESKSDEFPAKNALADIHSSEESLSSLPDKATRKGKLRELSSFRVGENSSSSLRKEDTNSEEGPGEAPLHLSGNGPKNTKTFGAKVAEYLQRGGSRLQEQQRRLKSQIWSSVVTIVLVEGKNLLAVGPNATVDPYVKFRLGNEKYKSKVELRTLNPRWLEQFDFHLFEDQSQLLEISVWDKDPRSKDDFIGKCTLDLREYERENTQQVWAELEGEGDLGPSQYGKLFLLLTISGTTSSASISDLITYRENPNELRNIEERYRLTKTFHNLRDVGLLTVKVFKAQGLAAADFGVGKSDPFCVMELVNSRLQTQTEYKTLAPSWNKIFTFDVKDIHSVLEITVYDEDRDHKVDFLGKIAIPLLRIKNGEKKWYALKDKKLRVRAKGNHPEILIECSVYWNPVRAAIQTIEPKEDKYMQIEPKFKRQIFVRNVNRVKESIMDIYEFGLFIKSCFEWESKFRSIVAFIFFIVITYYFEAYMLPAFILLLFLKNYIVISIVGSRYPRDEEADSSANEEEIDEDDKDKEEKKSLKERLQAIQEVIATVQNAIGYIASISESIKNTFNFTVPFLSWLMVIGLVLGMTILYYIPIRFLVLLWGINKFSRKLFRPHSVVNNEVIDFLSRVPDDEELKDFRELRANAQPHEDRKREAGKKKKNN